MNLYEAALDILQTANADDKAAKTRAYAATWFALNPEQQTPPQPTNLVLPDRPARPKQPLLKRPAEMPKRKKAGTFGSRVALLHALAHIELNAIDLAWDIMARFCMAEFGPDKRRFPIDFYHGWLRVASDEAKHFAMLQARLRELNSEYGALPAHDGLWESAQKTAHDAISRLAIVPMVLEARGLDVTPRMVENLRKQQDMESAAILQTIHDDEISHVAVGKIWFEFICECEKCDAETTWQNLVETYFHGFLKPPFNKPSRDKANFPSCWYEPIACMDIKKDVA